MSDAHNAYQRRYYTEREHRRLSPDLAGTPYVQRQVDAVVAGLGLAPGASVLDVGCGAGKYTIALEDRGMVVEGIDLTPTLIEQLTERRPDIPGHVGDAATPPAELHGRFDAAVGFFFLHHVEDLAAVLAGVRSTLRPDGRMAFLEPNPLFPGFYLQITFTPGTTWRGERGLFRMRPASIGRAAGAASLDLAAMDAFGAAPPAVANRPLGRRLERAVERLPGWRRVGAFQLIVLDQRGSRSDR